MKFHVIINRIKSVEELEGAWSKQDYAQLLEQFGLEESTESTTEELRELLFMAISDYEPTEVAEIVLEYRLSDHLNKNQISQISHEMLEDKISEEYADISLHHDLFNVNRLLFKAFNGKFPNTKATIIEFEMTSNQAGNHKISKEEVIKAFDKTLVGNHAIKRLFSDQIAGKESFDEAEGIIWKLDNTEGNSYILTTSEYWMSKEDFTEAEFDVNVVEFEEEENDD